MSNFLAPVINEQQVDANGAPLNGGTIEIFLAGSSTPVTTYSDQAGLVPNTNPLVLNTLGLSSQGAVWLTGGASYKYLIKNAAGVTQRTIDNVSGINDSAVTTDQWTLYQATPTYVSATSFSVSGDQTLAFQVGRRVKTVNTGGTVYSTITGSVYSAPNTTVTVANDSGTLDSGLSAVSYSVITVQNTSLPGGMPSYGQCRLTKSGANLLLSPFGGNLLTINDAICVIPAAGVTLAATSLGVGTVYYIYAYMSAGVLTLEASTTAYATSATTGVVTKSGDATRTLVGMARPTTGPAWIDTARFRYVISWFNRRPLGLKGPNTAATAGITTGTLAEADTNIRAQWLAWSGDSVSYALVAGITSNATPGVVFATIGVNSATVGEDAGFTQNIPASSNLTVSIGSTSSGLTEGSNFLAFLLCQTGGTSLTIVYSGAASTGRNAVMSATVMG
jgi:hypothetical protein